MIPDWIWWINIVGGIAVWIVLPLQLGMTWRSHRQYQRWDAEERKRMARWVEDMRLASEDRMAASAMRRQAAIELAKVRGQLPQDYEGPLH
jgi:hypothetical protein